MGLARMDRQTVKRLAKADADYRKAKTKRKVMMLDAVSSGVPVADVAKATNVTRDAVYKLVQASRRDDR